MKSENKDIFTQRIITSRNTIRVGIIIGNGFNSLHLVHIISLIQEVSIQCHLNYSYVMALLNSY